MILLLVTLTSTMLAAIMSAVAWRSSRDERIRSGWRITALAAAIHQQTGTGAGVETSSDLFKMPEPGDGPPTLFRIAAGSLFVLAAIVALAIVSSNASSAASQTPQPVPGRQSAAATDRPGRVDGSRNVPDVPIELVALGYERQGDTLTVRGVVRNPPFAPALDRVTAVVLLFAEDGAFITSGRAAVESAALGAGGESGFTVTVPGAANVGRYRVSFRTDDRVVPHVDARDRNSKR